MPSIFTSLFWDVTSRHWITPPHCFEEHSVFIFKGLKPICVEVRNQLHIGAESYPRRTQS